MKFANFKIIFVLAVSIVLLTSCNEEKKTNEQASIPIMDFAQLEPLLNQKNDTTYVVNFWATWCAPCVKEIPYFEKLNEEYKSSKVKVILVNLDFPNQYESRLIPFVKERNIKSQVIMLDDPNANYWINEVNPSWSGSIPATLVYNKSKRDFYEQEFTYDELVNALNTINLN
ncbi:MAG TPA: redoxin family protein [Tenuifilaceae bacterium]|nr:redoxin family protein [Tenuifilaceae bacterium]HRX67748.1 redoxin family protein [Tenuifilaceae bacterium]